MKVPIEDTSMDRVRQIIPQLETMDEKRVAVVIEGMRGSFNEKGHTHSNSARFTTWYKKIKALTEIRRKRIENNIIEKM